MLHETTIERTSIFSVEGCRRKREGHHQVARSLRDGAATTCGGKREYRELQGHMQMFSGHGGFETQDMPEVWRPHRQLPEERPSLRCARFTQRLFVHGPEQQPSTGHVGAVPRDPRRVHG